MTFALLENAVTLKVPLGMASTRFLTVGEIYWQTVRNRSFNYNKVSAFIGSNDQGSDFDFVVVATVVSFDFAEFLLQCSCC